jgi:hypothetical protein
MMVLETSDIKKPDISHSYIFNPPQALITWPVI